MSPAAQARHGEKLLYTAKVHTAGGRDDGVARSPDGQLEMKFAPPGSGRPGTNPEQMLAAGWSACFEGRDRRLGRQAALHPPLRAHQSTPKWT